MAKVSVERWSAPISDEDKEVASKALGVKETDGFTVGMVEQDLVVITDADLQKIDIPLVVNPTNEEGEPLSKGPVTLTPNTRPVSTNACHKYKARWIAEYADGSIERQIGELGKENSTTKISRAGLRKVAFVGSDGGILASQDFEPGDMFFYRRRVAMRSDNDLSVLHILGKTQSEDGPNDIIFLYECDLHIETGDFGQSCPPGSKPRPPTHPVKWNDTDLVRVS